MCDIPEMPPLLWRVSSADCDAGGSIGRSSKPTDNGGDSLDGDHPPGVGSIVEPGLHTGDTR